eukprot:TRINITY_DN1292_c0_g2_i1.p1 TRINITY_DN1292_c0_g2~~TRINITY_DN1292_c0_g2_i1.p1  ORF type:complete len:108 (-),score=34.32 TRINITY_DN1292_c0_g2_i1:280-603(-)
MNNNNTATSRQLSSLKLKELSSFVQKINEILDNNAPKLEEYPICEFRDKMQLKLEGLSGEIARLQFQINNNFAMDFDEMKELRGIIHQLHQLQFDIATLTAMDHQNL